MGIIPKFNIGFREPKMPKQINCEKINKMKARAAVIKAIRNLLTLGRIHWTRKTIFGNLDPLGVVT